MDEILSILSELLEKVNLIIPLVGLCFFFSALSFFFIGYFIDKNEQKENDDKHRKMIREELEHYDQNKNNR